MLVLRAFLLRPHPGLGLLGLIMNSNWLDQLLDEKTLAVFYYFFFHEIPWLHLLIGFLGALLFVRYSILAAHRYEVLARPSQRASHTLPTPRLGGVGVALTFYLVAGLMYFRPYLAVKPSPWNAAIIVGGAWAFVGGFLDDVLELNPRWKFLFQFTAAGAALALGFSIDSLQLPNGLIVNFPHWLGLVLTFGFIVFVMNAYNFMDGMDGQASLFGTIVSLGLCLPLVAFNFYMAFFAFKNSVNMAEAQMLAVLAGCLLGLLAFNYPGKPQQEKTFMGDSGSQFVGYLLAVFSLRVEQVRDSGFSLIAALILLSPFIWDVCYTLVRRLLHGENVLQAHRSHLYQRLLIAGWSHGQALALNTILWVACFWLSQFYALAGRTTTPVMMRWAILGAAFGALVLYTLIVLVVEKKAKAQNNP